MKKRDKKKLQEFVDSLTENEARGQLYLAYMMMERCIRVLQGYDVSPVKMKDNGLSSEMELFYQCKRTADTIISCFDVMINGSGEEESVDDDDFSVSVACNDDGTVEFSDWADGVEAFAINVRDLERIVRKAKEVRNGR